MASGSITSWQIDGETTETVADFTFPWAPKSLQIVTAAMKLKDACSLSDRHLGCFTMEYYSAIKKNTFESVLMR